MKCVHAMENMDEKLRAACRSPTANLDQVLQVIYVWYDSRLLFTLLTTIFSEESMGAEPVQKKMKYLRT